MHDKKVENIVSDDKEVDSIGVALEFSVKERPQLGNLPSFIPFNNVDNKSWLTTCHEFILIFLIVYLEKMYICKK